MSWSDTEKEALVGDRSAVIQVVSALRRYREASRKMLGARYSDGECDGYAINAFCDEVKDIEDPEDDVDG